MLRWYKVGLLGLCFLLGGQGLYGQKEQKILIANINIQIEATQALNDLYNFNFESAEQQFRWFKQKYYWHPLPYFLLGLSQWWKIVPNTRNTSYDKPFLAYMDSTVAVAKNLYKKSKEYRTEAAFFLAAAHGFKGRLYTEETRKKWGQATSEGRAALKYLKISKKGEHLSPELLFGDALYNYFAVWVPENYSMFKPLLWFFPKGDKELGLKQLTEVSYNAFYTRTEAMVWLMRILNGYENEPARALQIAEYLYQTYPKNPYFHRYYVRCLYTNSRFKEMEKQARLIIHRIDSAKTGYEANSGRYATYYLGRLSQMRGNPDEAIKYYLLMLNYARTIGDDDSGYYFASLLELGTTYQQQGSNGEAANCFMKIKKGASRKSERYKEAVKRLKQLKRRKYRK